MSITICGKSTRVVDIEGFTIDELAGNVASNDDTISIALVHAPKGTSEPWLTLFYDEWICVLEGVMVFSREGQPDVEARAGQTIKISSGTRFKPSFPTADTRYVPVCLPAFTPDRCVREDEEGKTEVASRLSELHERKEAEDSGPEVGGAETLYHMTTVAEWESCQEYGCYYPTTFEKDGHYTHATAVPKRLVETANHFYQDIKGEWICIEFKRSSLRKCGIFVRDEEALPVGDQAVSSEWVAKKWVCPHVIGGIPVSVVEKIYPMKRGEGGKSFLGIEGL